MKLRYYLRGLGIGMLVAALVLVLSGNTDAKMSDEAVKRRAAELGMVEKDKSVLGDVEGTEVPENNELAGQPKKEETEPSFGNKDAESEESKAENAGTGDAESEEQKTENAGAGKEEVKDDEPEEAEVKDEEPENIQAENPQKQNSENGNGDTSDIQENKEAPAQSSDEILAREIEERAGEVIDRAEEVGEGTMSGTTITFVVRNGDSSISVARRAEEAGLVSSAADFDVFLCQNGYDKRISIGSYVIAVGSSEKDIADIITKSR